MDKLNNINIYKVYIHKNKINNKVYIGITKQKPEKRWNNGKGYKPCVLFYRAILKYGWSNFEHIILFDNLTKKESQEIEIELIHYHKSNNPKFGYNISKGGELGGISEEARQKLIKMRKGHKLKGIQLENLIKANGKKIICLETKEIFNTIIDASKKLKINRYSISSNCRKKNNEAHSFHFLYLEEYNENIKYNLKNNFRKKVICINNKQIYNSIREASRMLNINSGDICNICKHNLKSINGLIFKYLKDYLNENNGNKNNDKFN